MKISFFEEFPIKRNLSKLKLITWPTKLYIAAPSLPEFERGVRGVKMKGVTKLVYWPILQKKEGYWISPFSKRKALLRIFQELEEKRIPVMLDLELPTTQNPSLYLTQFPHFITNKKLIKKFIHQYSGDIYLAEYYPEGKRKEKMLQFFGLHYQRPKAKIIKMLYHSMHSFREEFVKLELRKGQQEYGRNFLVAYGTMGAGIQRTEPNISVKQLEQDLRLAQQAGIKEIIIYRLGGMNEDYARVLKKYARK